MRMCYSFNDVEKLQKKNNTVLKPAVSTLDMSQSNNIFLLSSPISYGKFLSENKYTSRKLRRYVIQKFYSKL